MNKPARPSLSDVMPAKGAASRPEPLPDDAADTAPPEAPEVMSSKPARVVRIPLTVKVSEPVYRRLREASFRAEVDKQDLVDQALDALLTKMGF
jgi:hypothetical protein